MGGCQLPWGLCLCWGRGVHWLLPSLQPRVTTRSLPGMLPSCFPDAGLEHWLVVLALPEVPLHFGDGFKGVFCC